MLQFKELLGNLQLCGKGIVLHRCNNLQFADVKNPMLKPSSPEQPQQVPTCQVGVSSDFDMHIWILILHANMHNSSHVKGPANLWYVAAILARSAQKFFG